MKFFVTGSSGLVGTQIVKDLSNSDKNIVYSGYHNDEPEHGFGIKLDITNFEKISEVLQEIKPTTIIHLASMTDVEQCEKYPQMAYKINADATEYLARESAKINAFILYVSTDYVFDGKQGLRKENEKTNPLGIYGKSKLEGEKKIQNFAPRSCIARISTPFGLHKKKKSFPLWVLENLKQNNEVNILIDQFTSPTYVPNLSQMLIELATKQISGLFHVAGATRISRYELANMIAEKKNLNKKLLKPITMNKMTLWTAKRPLDSSLNVVQISKLINTKPMAIELALDNFLNEVSIN